ncbi:HhH-GPD superfamily base excision DNA repair protein [Kockiozyma suomiensis]|uniref:HhH-GPD superfamily base excision DNA repair protein n=1 Tax=Kockiozyma suomiensis TaxID=1337062 RepID=UPI003343CD38
MRVTRSRAAAALNTVDTTIVSSTLISSETTSSITTAFKSTKRSMTTSLPKDSKRRIAVVKNEKYEELGKFDKPAKRTKITTITATATSETPVITKKESATKKGYIPADQILIQDVPISNDGSVPAPMLIVPKAYEKDFTLNKALSHLISIDPRFEQLSDLYPCQFLSEADLEKPVNPFEALGSSIISQQISGSAARSIKARFVALFNRLHPKFDDENPEDADQVLSSRFPTPEEVLKVDAATLRSIGFSGRKAEYMLDLATKFHSGEINPHDLVTMSDEEVIELLVKVRGLGVWSCEMFLIFALKRPNVFSLGDLGVQRGMASWWGKNLALAKGKKGKFKYMSEQEMIEKSEMFRPYRTLFTWYMWKAGDVIVPIDGAGEIKKIKE